MTTPDDTRGPAEPPEPEWFPNRPLTPELARLLAMPPRRVLDEGHQLSEVFDRHRLEFLAEKAISDRLLDSPAEKERARLRAAQWLDEVLDDDPERAAATRWHAEILSDDAFAERFVAALPEACRRAQEDHVDRFLRPIVLVAVGGAEGQTPAPLHPWEPTLHPGDPVLCGLCGEPIVGPHVQLTDRRGHYNGDEESDRDYRIYDESFDRVLAALCSTCLPPLPDVDAALAQFYLEVQHVVGAAASEGRTVEGVAKAVKKVGQAHRLRVADELPLPGLSRKERER